MKFHAGAFALIQHQHQRYNLDVLAASLLITPGVEALRKLFAKD